MTKKENLLHFLRREAYEYVPEGLPLIQAGSEGEALPPAADSMALNSCGLIEDLTAPVCERPMFGEGYDVFGVHWSKTAAVSHYTPGQKPIYDDIEDWESQVRIPNVERFDWAGFEADVKRLDTENKLVCITLFCGLFERATMLTTMENCLIDVISEPEHFSDMLGAIADYKIALINKICRYVHPDIIIYHDDWGTNVSTFMSPELWRQVVKPHTKRLYDAMNAQDITICQHSCGCVAPLVGDIVEMGAKMVDLQSSCTDLEDLSRRYGDRLFIMTNNIGGTPPPDGDHDAPPPLVAKYPAYPEKPEFLYA